MARNVSEDLFAFALTASFTICGTSFFFMANRNLKIEMIFMHKYVCVCVVKAMKNANFTFRSPHLFHFVELSISYPSFQTVAIPLNVPIERIKLSSAVVQSDISAYREIEAQSRNLHEFGIRMPAASFR